MANHAGKEGTAKVGANTIAELKAWQFTETGENVDDTTMGDDARTHKATVTSWEGSFDVLWDETDTNAQGAMTVNASVTLNMYPEGADSGDTFYSGTATITSIARSATAESLVEAIYSFLGNGALTEATV